MVLADLPYDEPDLIRDIVRLSRSICRGNAVFFMSLEDVAELEDRPDQVLLWEKTPSTKNTSRQPNVPAEAIVVYWTSKARTFNTDLHWSNYVGIYRDILWHKHGDDVHPHAKPITLIERLIHIYSNPGDRILDPCTGSGTTIQVAIAMCRPIIAIEKERRWIDHILRTHGIRGEDIV